MNVLKKATFLGCALSVMMVSANAYAGQEALNALSKLSESEKSALQTEFMGMGEVANENDLRSAMGKLSPADRKALKDEFLGGGPAPAGMELPSGMDYGEVVENMMNAGSVVSSSGAGVPNNSSTRPARVRSGGATSPSIYARSKAYHDRTVTRAELLEGVALPERVFGNINGNRF